MNDRLQSVFAEEAEELLRRIETATQGLTDAEPAERTNALLEVQRALHTLKGAAAAAGLRGLKDDIHDLEEGLSQTAEENGLLTLIDVDTVTTAVDRWRSRISPVTPTDQLPTGDTGERMQAEGRVLRIRGDRMDALQSMLDELILSQLQQEGLSLRSRDLQERHELTNEAWRGLVSYLRELRGVLPADEYAVLRHEMEQFSETLAQWGKQSAGLVRSIPSVTAQQQSAVSGLERALQEMRLMRLDSFLQEFGHAVREAAEMTGKKARILVQADGEADRAVLMRLREPILHLVRNAVSHGIESVAQRQQDGKEEAGCVLLQAHTEGGRALFRIADDGSGIDVERVIARARDMGIECSDNPDDESLLELLAHAGFSTRHEADALSGRGVGLESVENTIRELDGTLSLDNLPGLGSAFHLSVPIHASTNLGLVVECGTYRFGILLPHVDRVLRSAPGDIYELEGVSVLDVEGESLGVAALGDLLRVEEDAGLRETGQCVVIRVGQQRLVLQVDDIPGEQLMVIKPFGRALADSELFMGGAIEADGSILPVLKVAALLQQASGRKHSFIKSSAEAGLQRVSRVLVVDDSFTMRTLQQSILESAGYEVVGAEDGRKGRERFGDGTDIDLVVTDLEMPELSGVELCRLLRASANPDVPILMVTSVGDAEQKRQALEAGADAYLIKGDFEQSSYLQTVARLVGSHGVGV